MERTAVAALLEDEGRVAAVAAAAGIAPETLGDPRLELLPCVLTNMTTEDLGRVRFGPGPGARSIVIKIARSPRHSPLWERIPESSRELSMTELPWRAEADLYRSPLRLLLPPGLRMPALYAVDEIDDDRVALWMEDIEERPEAWRRTDYLAAARALGRMAGSLPEPVIPADVPVRRRDFRGYFFGRVRQGTMPALRDDTTWTHALVHGAVDPRLRDDLLVLEASAPRLLDPLDRLPRTLAHGDACPQNLLRPAAEDDTVVAIDWTFAGVCSLGTDAGQLLAGHAESGELEPARLPELLDDIVEAYGAGVTDAGATVNPDDVRFGVVANLVIRSAFTALPVELLEVPGNDESEVFFQRRAQYARFLVDLGLELVECV